MGDHESGVAGAGVRRSIRISSRSGRVEVVAEPRDGVVASKGGREVDVDDDGTLTISSRSSTLVVRVPEGSDVVVGTISGRITLKGRFGAVAASSVSAGIEIESAEQIDVRNKSGRVEIGSCTGEVRIDAVSGRAKVHSAGAVAVGTASGRIEVDAVRGKVRARAISGRIAVTVTATPLDVKAETVSGRITITAPPSARPHQTLRTAKGSVASELPQGDDGVVLARTISGSVRLLGSG
jgi:DUF4097 and DUF4098 domain-containing protein YvlB